MESVELIMESAAVEDMDELCDLVRVPITHRLHANDKAYGESSKKMKTEDMTKLDKASNSTQLSRADALKMKSKGGCIEVNSSFGIYNWDHCWRLPKHGEGIISFVADGVNDLHIAISPRECNVDPMYEIIIGGWDNTTTVIRRKAQGVFEASTRVSLISLGNINRFWVSIDRTTNLIQVGRGNEGKDLLCSFKDFNFLSTAQCVAFSSWNTRISYSNIEVSTTFGIPSQDNLKATSLNTTVESLRLEDKDVIEVHPLYGHYAWNQHWMLSKPSQGIISFTVLGSSDVHIAFSPRLQTVDPMYEIVIGGWNNTKSVVRRKSQGNIMCVAAMGLTSGAINKFWVSLDAHTQVIQVGRGTEFDDVLCIYKDLDFIHDVQYISFTSWDTPIWFSNVTVASTTIDNKMFSFKKPCIDLSRESVPSSSPQCHVEEKEVKIDSTMDDSEWISI